MASIVISAQSAMLLCLKHTTEEMDMYCHRCKKATCTKCMAGDHLGHDVDTIAKFSRRLTNNRDGFLEELTAKYQMKRKPKLRKFREVRCRNEHVLSNNVTSLEERRENLHTLVDELIDKDINRCRDHSTKLTEEIAKTEQKHAETDDKIQEMISTFAKTTMTGLDIIEYYDKLRSLVEQMESEVDIAKYRDMLVYREGEVDRGQLQHMVGDVKEAKKESENDKPVNAKTEPKKQGIAKIEPRKQAIAKTEPTKQAIADSKPAEQQATTTFLCIFAAKKNVQEFKKVSEPKEIEKIMETDEKKKVSESKKVEKITETHKAKKASGSRDQLSAFRYNESCVYDIRPVSHGEAWIKYEKIGQLTLLNRSGQVKDTVPKEKGNNRFCVTNDKRFISSDYTKQVVVSIEHSGKTSTILSTSPLYPLDIGPALNGNILVTLVDEWEFTRTADSQRKVQMITSGGDLLHTYEFGEDCATPIFTAPFRPTQNFNSNLCAINQYKTAAGVYRGDVCVFYEDGGLKFVYSGHGGAFGPNDVCCDSLCNIICTNVCDRSVHVIDSDGVFLEYLLTSDTCVPRPTAVALYRDALWVGSELGEVRVYRYKYQ